MKKILIAAAIATALLSTGCARYQPAQQIIHSSELSETGVRNKIIIGATRNQWTICAKGERSLRLHKIYRNYNIFLNADYSPNGYKLTVDTQLTNLKDDEGNVHKAVNKLLHKLDKHIRIAIPNKNGLLADYEIPSCKNLASSESKKGSIFTRWTGNATFAWTNDKVNLAKNDNFSYQVDADLPVPDILIQNMNERIGLSLSELSRLSETDKNSDYRIHVHLFNFIKNSNGGGGDAMLGTGEERLEAQVAIYDHNNKQIATIKANARVPTGGVFGGINKATNRITGVLNQLIFDSIKENLSISE